MIKGSFSLWGFYIYVTGRPAAWIVSVVFILIGTLMVRGGASDVEAAKATAAADALPASAQAVAPPESSGAAVAPPVVSAALRVEDLPTSSASPPTASKRKPAAAPGAAPAAAPVKRNCSPPYELDSSGNKRWKRECL